VSAPVSATGIKIDRTAPKVTGKPTTNANSAGWYSSAILVDFTCTDGLSGVAECPTSVLLSGDGANQTVTSGPAKDVAGHTATTDVTGLNIDTAAPATASDIQCVRSNGFCIGTSATVVLTALDQPGLSGVKELHYRVENGAEQVVAGATATVTVPLGGTGAGTVTYWAVDRADNAETSQSTSLKWDNIAPSVSHTVTPASNADGWNNTSAVVHFTAKDDDAGSGIDATSITGDVAVDDETSGREVAGSARDIAGNEGTDTVTVKIDKTEPTIAASIVKGTVGLNGWYSGAVTVHYTCADSLSGIASCPDDQILTENSLASSASGTATDKAGNTATATLTGIKIDQEKPALTKADVNVDGATYILGAVPAAKCSATDTFSGIASCSVTVTGGKANGVGTFTYTAVATDKAGNRSTVTGTYKVIYQFKGFLEPIRDPRLDPNAVTDIRKSGSNLPTKFQLTNASGAVVQAGSAPLWLTPAKGNATTAPVDETDFGGTADSGSTYRYDSGSQQYQYNWKTSGAGYYWRIGVTLDDGQTYYVTIGLR
jgi:hypothetical protein